MNAHCLWSAASLFSNGGVGRHVEPNGSLVCVPDLSHHVATFFAQVDDIPLEFYELMLEFLRQFLANGGRSSKPFRFMKRRNQDGELLNCSRGSPEAGASSTGLTQIHSDVTVATWRAAPVRTQQPCTQVRDIPKSVHEKTFYSNWCTTRGVAFGFANSTRFSQARRIPVAPQSCHVLPPTRSSFS